MQLRVIDAASEGSYGRPRRLRALREQGERIGGERERRLMHEQGLRSVHRKPFRVTTDSRHDHPIAPNLVARQFVPAAPDRLWLTPLATDEGWLYVAGVLDGATRRIVGWSMSDRLKAPLTCDALRMAYWRRKPAPGLIAHSDRGVQGGFNRSSQHSTFRKEK
jgi:transposase InsO family protein